jgi:hypothetical protein
VKWVLRYAVLSWVAVSGVVAVLPACGRTDTASGTTEVGGASASGVSGVGPSASGGAGAAGGAAVISTGGVGPSASGKASAAGGTAVISTGGVGPPASGKASAAGGTAVISTGGEGPSASGGAGVAGGTAVISTGGVGPSASGGAGAADRTAVISTGGVGPSAGGDASVTSGTVVAMTGDVGPSVSGGTGAAGGTAGYGGGGAGTPPGECVFLVPANPAELSGTSFFDHPWPSDFRLDANGLAEFAGFPNPRPSALLSSYVTAVDGSLAGFSPAAPGYLRFNSPIDQATLPADPVASLAPTSSVQLINVDPSSPTQGQRLRVSLAWHPTADGYWTDNTLAFMPTPGFPLREGTRYALVVTNALTAAGTRLGACGGLRQVLGLEVATGAAGALRDAWADAVARLESAGIPRTAIAHLTVFTTDRPTLETRRLRDWVVSNYPLPEPSALTPVERTLGVMDTYEGSYGPSPDFQAGTPPFLLSGGDMTVDGAGNPAVARELELRFVLSVPSSAGCPLPAAGYPVVLYAHGTGGSYRSVVTNGAAGFLAARCLASVGIDQIFHGTRPGGPCAARGYVAPCNPLPESVAVFNAQNPASLRNTNRQAAIDLVQLARLVSASRLVVAAGTSYTGQRIDLDAGRVLLMAHSQGATSGPLALAVDDQLLGGVLSGSAAMASLSLLGRSQPQNLSTLMTNELYGAGSGATLEVFHPVMSLLQTMLDEGDPLHYAASIVAEPPAGFAPKSLLMVEGIGADGQSDSYVSSHAIEVHALAIGLPPLLPLVWPIPEYGFSSLSPVEVPSAGLAGNLALGNATGALVQWAPPPGNDPHFVIFDVPAASAQAATFLQSLAVDRLGRIPPF